MALSWPGILAVIIFAIVAGFFWALGQFIFARIFGVAERAQPLMVADMDLELPVPVRDERDDREEQRDRRERREQKREHVTILLDDDVRIEGHIEQARLDQIHEIAFALAADTGMEFDANGQPRPTTRPNTAFGKPQRKSVTLTLTLTLDPETAVVWQRSHRARDKRASRAAKRANAPLHPKGDIVVAGPVAVVVNPADRVLRADLLLQLLAIVPLAETIDAYRRLMGGQFPPQRRLTRGHPVRIVRREWMRRV